MPRIRPILIVLIITTHCLKQYLLSLQNHWGIVQEQNALVIQQNGLKQVKQILLQYQIKYKAGRIAQRQLAQAKSEVISQAISIEQAQVSFKNNYDGLLDMINLKTSTQFTLDDQVALPKSITLPSLDHVMAIIFEHDLGYQQAKIAVTSAKRALQVPEDNMRSDLTAQVTGHSQTPHFSGSLSWSIPLDRLPLNQARSAAQIAYIEAQHAFLDKRSALKTEINTLYSNYLMAKRQLKLVEEKADYEKLNYHAMSEREHFGRVSSFELFSNYNTMINAKSSGYAAKKIQLLTAFLTLKQRMGQLLDYFDILLPDSGD